MKLSTFLFLKQYICSQFNFLENMKRIFFLSALALVFVACNKSREDNKITFETFISDEICPVNPQDTVGGGCTVAIEFIYPTEFKDSTVLANVQQEIVAQMFGDEYVGSTPQEIITEYVNSERQNWLFMHDDFASALSREKRDVLLNYSTTLKDSICFNKGGILALQLTKSIYEGGAYGLTSSNFLLFNLQTGVLMTEDDIFEGDYNPVLSAVFDQKLKELLGSDEVGSATDSVMANGNFYADNEGITYRFHQDDIAFASLNSDEIDIFIPYEELKEVLKEESPLAVFW
jgi:hypothetical protein